MTKRRDLSDVPSPLLPMDEVNERLVNALGNLGAVGGAVGGRAGGGAPGMHGGASGGGAGGRFGARHFTRLDGAQRMMGVPRTDARLSAIRGGFFNNRAEEQFGVPPGAVEQAVMMVGTVGSGAGGMNPSVVQVVWFAQQVHVVAHAREGLIKQGTCIKAIRRFAEVLGSTA